MQRQAYCMQWASSCSLCLCTCAYLLHQFTVQHTIYAPMYIWYVLRAQLYNSAYHGIGVCLCIQAQHTATQCCGIKSGQSTGIRTDSKSQVGWGWGWESVMLDQPHCTFWHNMLSICRNTHCRPTQNSRANQITEGDGRQRKSDCVALPTKCVSSLAADSNRILFFSVCSYIIRYGVMRSVECRFSSPLTWLLSPRHAFPCSAGPVWPVGRAQNQPHLPAHLGGMYTCSKWGYRHV